LTLDLPTLLSLLREEYDVNSWWPRSSPFEVVLGAFLTQQTRWENVLTVLDSLREEGLLDVDSLAEIDLPTLEELVRPAGFYRQKAGRIRHFARYLRQNHDGEMESLLAGDLASCREELLSLPGIGPETADSILLFAGGKPVFVAASYCLRTLGRLGISDADDYETLRQEVEAELGPDAEALGDLYALLVELAKDRCRPRPLCDGCLLEQRCQIRT